MEAVITDMVEDMEVDFSENKKFKKCFMRLYLKVDMAEVMEVVTVVATEEKVDSAMVAVTEEAEVRNYVKIPFSKFNKIIFKVSEEVN